MIESLHSPHVARVKALLSSRGNRERKETGLFVAEGIQVAREAIDSPTGPQIDTLYYTASGIAKIADLNLGSVQSFEVSDDVMAAMSSTITPQGVLTLCALPEASLSGWVCSNQNPRIVYLHEIQDPGNAGTILRTADATGFDAVVTSPQSVDFYSPKVVRSTAGSLWHTPVFQGHSLSEVVEKFPSAQRLLFTADGKKSLLDYTSDSSYITIFGNEARGVTQADLQTDIEITEVRIPMAGRAESLNLSAAAAIVMFHLSPSMAG